MVRQAGLDLADVILPEPVFHRPSQKNGQSIGTGFVEHARIRFACSPLTQAMQPKRTFVVGMG